MNFLDHYSAMAAIPGARVYVWERVKEMARDCPELFGDLPAQLTERMKEQGK